VREAVELPLPEHIGQQLPDEIVDPLLKIIPINSKISNLGIFLDEAIAILEEMKTDELNKKAPKTGEVLQKAKYDLGAYFEEVNQYLSEDLKILPEEIYRDTK